MLGAFGDYMQAICLIDGAAKLGNSIMETMLYIFKNVNRNGHNSDETKLKQDEVKETTSIISDTHHEGTSLLTALDHNLKLDMMR